MVVEPCCVAQTIGTAHVGNGDDLASEGRRSLLKQQRQGVISA
jgi:hypothetical protein